MAKKPKYQVLGPLKPEELEALRRDIEARGVLVPVDVDEDGNILDGHHRVAIAKELGRPFETITRHFNTDDEKREHALKVNMARRHLQPHEWGAAFAKLLDLRGVDRGSGKRSDLSTCPNFRQVCDELGTTRGTAYDRLALADDYDELPEEEQRAVDSAEKTVRGAKRHVETAEKHPVFQGREGCLA